MSEPVDPRFRLANERTLLSWMRVALALVAAGTTAGTVVDIDPVLAARRAWRSGRSRSAWPRRCSASSAGSASRRRCATGVELPPDRELRLVAIAVALIAVVAGAAALVGVFR